MNFIDVLDLYAMSNDSDDLTLMLNDYPLDNRLSRDILNHTMIKELGPCRPFVHETTVFKFALDNFFNKYNYNIGKLVDTMYFEYNPIGNKNLTRTLDESEHRDSTADIDNTDSYTTNTDQTNTGTETTENDVSAYDATTYQPQSRSTVTPNLRTDNDVTHSGETTSDIVSDVDTQKDATETFVGKDGEISYQKLIEQERELSEFNIYNWIIKQMRKELFLLVY